MIIRLKLFVFPINLCKICIYSVCNSINITTHLRCSVIPYTIYFMQLWNVIKNFIEAHGHGASAFIIPVLELIQRIWQDLSFNLIHWCYPSFYLAPNTFYTVFVLPVRIHEIFPMHINEVLIYIKVHLVRCTRTQENNMYVFFNQLPVRRCYEKSRCAFLLFSSVFHGNLFLLPSPKPWNFLLSPVQLG